MAQYPLAPVPSSVSVATLHDPRHVYETDSGLSFRRSQWSRGLRQYQLDYLGVDTANMRFLRDFVAVHRMGVIPFDFVHPTAESFAAVQNTTPVRLTHFHGCQTGQWVVVWTDGAFPTLEGPWPVTWVAADTIALNNSTAVGTGTVRVRAYLPRAIAIEAEDTLPSPVKLIGPESVSVTRGRFNVTIHVRELF